VLSGDAALNEGDGLVAEIATSLPIAQSKRIARDELSEFTWYTAPSGALFCIPAPRAHNAPIYFHFYRLKSTNISFWGLEILQIVLFIRGMWSHVVLLFVAQERAEEQRQ
jgi:hypothetical protein